MVSCRILDFENGNENQVAVMSENGWVFRTKNG